MNNIGDMKETLMMIDILIDQIDNFYSVNSTLIRDIKPESAKFVLEKARGLLFVSLIKEVLDHGEQTQSDRTCDRD